MLQDTICRIRLSFWRMKTSMSFWRMKTSMSFWRMKTSMSLWTMKTYARFLLIRSCLPLKSDSLTRVYSITYVRVRIVNDKSYRVDKSCIVRSTQNVVPYFMTIFLKFYFVQSESEEVEPWGSPRWVVT